jgi:hypothetical protein
VGEDLDPVPADEAEEEPDEEHDQEGGDAGEPAGRVDLLAAVSGLRKETETAVSGVCVCVAISTPELGSGGRRRRSV